MDRIPGIRSRRSWKTGEPVSSLDGIGGIVRVGRCDYLPESPEFTSRVMPSGFRLFRRTAPAPDTSPVLLVIEYPDMAAYGARTAWEQDNPAWRELFAARPDSPERLVSVVLLSEFVPE